MKPIMTLPCKNRHSDMEKQKNGYHCKSCDHVLTDFRNSTTEEIQEKLQSNPGKTCGIFYSSQFDYKLSHVQLPAFRAVGLSLLGILGFLGPVITSCESDPAATEHKQKAFNQLKFPMHIKGKVNDEETGKPLPFFKVEVLQHGKLIKTVKTDENGNFDITVNEKDLDEEVFKLAIGGNGFENDTVTSAISKFRNKKVKLTIKAEAITAINTVGFVPPKIVNCTTIEGEIDVPEVTAGVPADYPVEPQEVYPRDQMEVVGAIAEQQAEFPGGQTAMQRYLKENLIYPQEALKNGIGGKVYLKFMVLADGSISKVTVQRGIADCPECNDEAVRVVKSMPKWKPSNLNGENTPSWYNLPIRFTIP